MYSIENKLTPRFLSRIIKGIFNEESLRLVQQIDESGKNGWQSSCETDFSQYLP
jgi:hypothetical protein